MKSKREIERTLKENKGADFVLPMTWDVMFEQMFISEEAMPLLECIISIFGNVDIKDVKGKVRLLPNELKQTSAKDTRSKSDIIADYFKDEKNIDKYIVEMNSSQTMPWRNVFYAYKVAGGGISIDEDKYVKAYDTILINFNIRLIVLFPIHLLRPLECNYINIQYLLIQYLYIVKMLNDNE